MKKTTNINQERSEKYRYLEKLNYVPKFIMITTACMFVAALALLISSISLYNSTASNAKVDYELQATRAENTATRNMIALHNVYLQELYFFMKAEGLNPPPLPEE